MTDNEITKTFDRLPSDGDANRPILKQVYSALAGNGYDPVSQIVGYIISEDPTYITDNGGARSLIRRLDREELLKSMLRVYLEI